MKNRRKGSLSEFILMVLEKSMDGFIRADHFINNPKYYAYGGGWDHPLKKSDLAQAIKRLREKGFVNQEVTNTEEIILKLTDIGRDVIANGIESKWDGKWRIVVFDIPEEKRVIRNLFRRNLKKWGFKKLQKSVWVSKNDVYDKLINYIEGLKINEWITVIEADKVSHHNI